MRTSENVTPTLCLAGIANRTTVLPNVAGCAQALRASSCVMANCSHAQTSNDFIKQPPVIAESG